MNLFSTTLMVDKRSNCQKEDAEILLLGAKPVNLDEYSNLKYVFRAGIGCDAVPIEQIMERQIKLFFPSMATRALLSDTVARMAVGYILTAATVDRRIEEWYREPRIGKPKILIYGAGQVGWRVWRICRECGYEPEKYDAKRDLERPVLGRYDIISLHIPLICYEHGSVFRDNRNLVDGDFLCRFSGVVVNTSRGGIVNESDMAEWLGTGKKNRYMTDVFAREPYTTDSPLHPYLNKQFFASPHTGSYSQEVQRALTQDVDNLLEAL